MIPIIGVRIKKGNKVIENERKEITNRNETWDGIMNDKL